jgi:hypothetical protein
MENQVIRNSGNMRISGLVVVALLLAIALSACSPRMGTTAIVTPENLQFHIGRWDKPVWEANLGYTVESSWPLLQEWYTTDAPFVIDLNDISAYSWGTHELWLTPEMSAEFETFFMGEGTIPAFVVTLKGQPIYGGVFMGYPSAMGIQYPVIYAERIHETIRFTIRPYHSIYWLDISTHDLNAIEDWQGIDTPGIKEVLSQAGKLEP